MYFLCLNWISVCAPCLLSCHWISPRKACCWVLLYTDKIPLSLLSSRLNCPSSLQQRFQSLYYQSLGLTHSSMSMSLLWGGQNGTQFYICSGLILILQNMLPDSFLLTGVSSSNVLLGSHPRSSIRIQYRAKHFSTQQTASNNFRSH